MKSALIKISWVLVAVLGFSAIIQAQTESQQQQQQPQTQPPNRPQSLYKAMVFDVKYRDPQDLANALEPLRSGMPNTSMVANRSMTVSYTHVRAHETPEHLVCRL